MSSSSNPFDLLRFHETPQVTRNFVFNSFNVPVKGEGQHFFGRYLITVMGTEGAWIMTTAIASLIDNGSVRPSEQWLDDNFLLIVRPSAVVASAAISIALYERRTLRNFLTLVAINSAEILAAHLVGTRMSDEANLLLQLTTPFLLVPLTSTVYNHLSTEKADITVGKTKINLLRPSSQLVDKKMSFGYRLLEVNW